MSRFEQFIAAQPQVWNRLLHCIRSGATEGSGNVVIANEVTGSVEVHTMHEIADTQKVDAIATLVRMLNERDANKGQEVVLLQHTDGSGSIQRMTVKLSSEPTGCMVSMTRQQWNEFQANAKKEDHA